MTKKVSRGLHRLARNENGSVLVEASVLMPMFMLLCLGLITLEFYVNNYVTLASSTAQAARVFAADAPVVFGSQTTTVSSTPYTDLQNTLKSPQYSGLLPGLNPAPAASGGITISSVCIYSASTTCAAGGTTCSSDTTCATALSNAAANLSQDPIVSVTTSYPCFVAFPIFGLNACTLTASASFPVQ